MHSPLFLADLRKIQKVVFVIIQRQQRVCAIGTARGDAGLQAQAAGGLLRQGKGLRGFAEAVHNVY